MKTYLQGAAFAALASAMTQSAWGGEAVTPVVDNVAAGALEQVTVTAEFREENLQKTPIAISVVSGLTSFTCW
jgi:iron complex outermembrane receptor protein